MKLLDTGEPGFMGSHIVEDTIDDVIAYERARPEADWTAMPDVA